jgi:hypothetical protein
MAALVVPCPTCATKLSAPESAVGKQIRCPKCGGLATVPDLIPAEEVPVVEAKVVQPPRTSSPPPPPPPPRPLPKPPIVAVDATEDRTHKETQPPEDEDDRPRKKKRSRYVEDDDDYEHDRPRKKPRRKAGSRGSGGLIAGVVIGVMLTLAGVGFAVYMFAGKKSPFARKTPVPAGWELHSYPQDGFKVYLPKPPTHMSLPTEGFRRDFGGGRGGRFGMGGWEIANELPEPERAALVSSGDRRTDVRIELYVIKYRDKVPPAIRDELRRAVPGAKFGGTEMRTVVWLGNEAFEQAHPAGVLRVVCADRHLVLAAISGPNGGRARPEEEAGFFDNFELTN